VRILIFSDTPAETGFGRISNNLANYLHYKRHDVRVAGLTYAGDPHKFPFHIWPLIGQDIWGRMTQLINTGSGDGWIPELVISIQDFPYHVSLGRDCPILWDNKKWIFITPIDGSPVYKEWEAISKIADGRMVISRFGVEAMRKQGVKVDLAHPGIDRDEFYPASAGEKEALRKQAGFPDPNAWVLGIFCMNQGRKAIPNMMDAFREFALDKENVVLYLDMDDVSPAGWQIPVLAEMMGLPTSRILLRKHLGPRLPRLRDRYAVVDAHAVLSYREGFGLPLLESMACRIPTIAQDWCSGTEIVGEGRGYLVPVLRDIYGEPVMQYSTWGNAKDAIPDNRAFVAALNDIYYNPKKAAGIAQTGYEWAIQQTWERLGEQVAAVIQRVTAITLSGHSDLQQNDRASTDDASLHRIVDGDGARAGANGDYSDGRLESDLAGARLVFPTVQVEPEREEFGVRSELQQGSKAGDGGLSLIPEQRYGSDGGMVRESGQSDDGAPQRDSGAKAPISS
jgi:glycosyltransferase involved in cell wall biosynthesis